MYGKISASGDVDYFKVTWYDSGRANFFLDVPSGVDYDFELFDANGKYLTGSYKGTGAFELISEYHVETEKTYIMKVYGVSGAFSSTNEYLVRAKLYPWPDQYESNDTPATAKTATDTTRYANLHDPYDIDYYKAILTQKSKLYVDLSDIPKDNDYDVVVYNENNVQVASSTAGGSTDEKIEATLPAGNYYIKVFGYDGSYHKNYYKLKIAHAKVWENVDHGTWTVTSTFDDPDGPTVFYKKTMYLNKNDANLLAAAIKEQSVRDKLLGTAGGFITDTSVAAACAAAGMGFFSSTFVGLSVTTMRFFFDIVDDVDLDDALSRSTTGKLKIENFDAVKPVTGEYYELENIEPWNDKNITEVRGYHGTYSSSVSF